MRFGLRALFGATVVVALYMSLVVYAPEIAYLSFLMVIGAAAIMVLGGRPHRSRRASFG